MENTEQLQKIIEAALLVAGEPLSIVQLQKLFSAEDAPEKNQIREAIKLLQENNDNRGVELVEIASGFTYRVPQALAPWMQKLWEEKPPKYSRAVLETLALIAYKQPITRGEIEEVRGVVVSSQMIKTLLEREWVKVVGYKDVPGRPALYATTKQFLDYFNLKSISDLPTLMSPTESVTDADASEDNPDTQLELVPVKVAEPVEA